MIFSKITFNINQLYKGGKLIQEIDYEMNSYLKLAFNDNFFDFIKETLNLFSDLAYNRNYLWKKELKSHFPKEFLIPSIFDMDLPSEIRSVFCKLAMSLYIDHEPFFPAMVPNMARVYGKVQTMRERDLNSSTLNFQLTSFFTTVASKSNKKENLDQINKNDPNFLYVSMVKNLKNYISAFEVNKNINEFLFHLLELLYLVIELDIFSLINPTIEDFHSVVRNVVLILEHDPLNHKLTKLFIENRSKIFSK